MGYLMYYQRYLAGFSVLDVSRVKYFDESHFDPADTRRRRGVCPRGQRLVLPLVGHEAKADRFTVTLITTPTCITPVWHSKPSKKSNDQWRFLQFIIDSLAAGALRAGDVLIGDNAKIHYAEESRDLLELLLDTAQVRLVFLPTYSPELNPCENVFGWVKSRMRYHRGNDTFSNEICKAFASVTHGLVYSFYRHCINPRD